MWLRLDNGEFVEGPCLRWEHRYTHRDGYRHIKCGLFESKGKLQVSVSYKAEAKKAMLPCLRLGKYVGKIIEGHVFEVEVVGDLPIKYLIGWGKKQSLRCETIDAALLPSLRGYEFVEGTVNVYWRK